MLYHPRVFAPRMRRRDALKGLFTAAGALLLPRSARAFGETSKLAIGQIEHGGRWNPRPSAMRRLGWEIAQRTSIETANDVVPVKLGAPGLHRHPMLYLSGDGPFAPFTDPELAALRRHLNYGGFLLADSADGSDGTGFDAAVRKELSRLFPSSPLARVPREHVVYKSFYLIDHQGGRVLVKPHLEAQEVNGRLAVIYSQNDLGGAWSRGELGDWEYDCTPGGEAQRESAFRLGVNLAMYALCTDYKDDAVHLPFIMKRRT
jgi:hypothetical protein